MIELLTYLLAFAAYLIRLYIYVILAAVIMSWLIGFNVINGYNPVVRSIWQGLGAVTEPLLKPIRRRLPSTGGIDFAPLVLVLACIFVIGLIQEVLIAQLLKLK